MQHTWICMCQPCCTWYSTTFRISPRQSTVATSLHTKKGDWQKMEISFYFYDNLIDAHISTLFLFASLKLPIFSNIWIQFKILIKLLLKWRTAPRVAKVANKQSLILSIVWYNHLIYLLLRINSATIKCEWNAN